MSDTCLTSEQEAQHAKIAAEVKARFEDPEVQRAARLFFAEADRRSRQKTPAQRRREKVENWWFAGFTVVAIIGACLVIPPVVLWLEKVTKANHPGMHWVPQVNGHWEKNAP